MADPIKIRNATDEDIPATVTIFREAFPDNTNVQMGPRTCEAYLSSLLNLDSYRFVVVCCRDEVLGFAVIQIDRTRTISNRWMFSSPLEMATFFLQRPVYLIKRGFYILKQLLRKRFLTQPAPQSTGFKTKPQTSSYLLWIALSEKARGLGIGRRLLEHCVQIARSQGNQYVDLISRTTNTHAHKVFEAAGFRRIRYDKKAERYGFRLFLSDAPNPQ